MLQPGRGKQASGPGAAGAPAPRKSGGGAGRCGAAGAAGGRGEVVAGASGVQGCLEGRRRGFAWDGLRRRPETKETTDRHR